MIKKIHNLLYQLKKYVFYRNKLLRIWQTRNYKSGKVAIGESNDYHFPKEWMTVDKHPADFRVDLNSDYSLPFDNGTIGAIYSAHIFEHLTPSKANYGLEEVYRVLSNNGKLRIEVPDVKKLYNAYMNGDIEYVNHFTKFHGTLVEKHNFPEKYKELHLGLMGTISNYFIDNLAYQIPVYATEKEFKEKIDKLSFDDFCDWCVSLQTPEQYASPGHKTFFFPEKLKNILEKIGFKNVNLVDFNKTSYAEFQLNKGKGSIQEKPHRTFFSMYMEAQK